MPYRKDIHVCSEREFRWPTSARGRALTGLWPDQYCRLARPCPTEAQVVAMLDAHATRAMNTACRVTGCDALQHVIDAVDRAVVDWSEVMLEPDYAVAQVFDDFFGGDEYYNAEEESNSGW